MTGMPKSKYVEPGTRFWNFTFLKYTVSYNGSMKGLFKCDFCGEERERLVTHVRTGYVKVCHCQTADRITIHGHTRGGSASQTYNAWCSMKKRCLNLLHPHYKDYGGRGITVCDRWLQSFDNFLADMGEKPTGLSLERKNNDLGYFPGNCCWASAREQNNNRRNNTPITFNGTTMNVTGWARHLGLKKNALIERLRKGWSIERALTTPPQSRYSHANRPPAAS